MTDRFADRLLDWFDRSGRHDLPWQHPRTPYRVWVSEIMLQQTQVATVIDYFDRFMTRFPTIEALADASVDDVLALWSGLGYYARGRNLHRAACQIRDVGMPSDLAGWQALPGVGPSTAAAIIAQAYDEPATILDGNVKRVMARHAGIDTPLEEAGTVARLYEIAVGHTPPYRAADYTQAIMDLGATVCRRSSPACMDCPVQDDCVALATDRVADLPVRQRRKAVPVRRWRFLAFRDPAGRLLLVRRPPSGIWGGLWCLPAQDESGVEPPALANLHEIEDKVVVHAFRHRFTHFQLEAEICRLQLADASMIAEDAGQYWLGPEGRDQAIARLGLPGPIAQILREGQV